MSMSESNELESESFLLTRVDHLLSEAGRLLNGMKDPHPDKCDPFVKPDQCCADCVALSENLKSEVSKYVASDAARGYDGQLSLMIAIMGAWYHVGNDCRVHLTYDHFEELVQKALDSLAGSQVMCEIRYISKCVEHKRTKCARCAELPKKIYRCSLWKEKPMLKQNVFFP